MIGLAWLLAHRYRRAKRFLTHSELNWIFELSPRPAAAEAHTGLQRSQAKDHFNSFSMTEVILSPSGSTDDRNRATTWPF
jgi:hypothetical protein